MSDNNHTTNWPELAIGLYDRLTEETPRSPTNSRMCISRSLAAQEPKPNTRNGLWLVR